MGRTKNGRAPFWVIVKDTYGHDEVVYRTTTEDDARCFMQEYHLGPGEYNIRIQDNQTGGR
jgi:hypothetical protein